VDRHEDVTDPNKVQDDPETVRSIVFYGYVRGTHLKPGMKVHLIGVGDYNMTSVTALPDPLPLPDKESERTVSRMFGFLFLFAMLFAELELSFCSYHSFFVCCRL
jgi:AARP2CN (NUC121) domain